MTTAVLEASLKSYIQRGQFYGPLYDVDHLATFPVGSKHGVLKAEDGIRKLRILEKSQGIWTMECQLLIDLNYLVLYDKKNGKQLESFPIEQISEPTSVVSDNKNENYNNILLFTFLPKTNTEHQTEMHLFQCNKASSTEIVDEIFRAKEAREEPAEEVVNKPHSAYHRFSHALDNNNNPKQKPAPLTQTNPVDLEVQILNHCFDDIELFVSRLQYSSENFKELEKKHKSKKTNKKQLGEKMLKMRAQMPQPEHFVDTFQKIKYSFNLLAKLKSHIHDPNAPELVHFLFTPLALIVNTTKEPPYEGLGKTVWMPLLNRDAKDLLLNCLSSKEQDLWMSLGEAWYVTREEIKLKPHLHLYLENQNFTPKFSDGWTPSLPVQDFTDNRNDITSRLAFETAAQANHQKQQQQKPRFPIQPVQNSSYQEDQTPYSANSLNSKSLNNRSVQSTSQINKIPQAPPISGQLQQHLQSNVLNSANSNQIPNSASAAPNTTKLIQIRNYEEMKKWAVDLTLRGAKVYEVIHDRQGNNDKELTVKQGELVEVLDDKRNWWKLRNFYGLVGHAPVTILRRFEFNDLINSQKASQIAKNSYY